MSRARAPLAGALLVLVATTGGACVLIEQYDPPVMDVPDGGTGGHVTASSSAGTGGGATSSTSTSGGHGGAMGTGGATIASTGAGGGVASASVASVASGTGGGMVCKPLSTQGCYTGPAATEGVGPCKGGTSTCSLDGTAWGPCAGEVVPALENCATPVDEDCDGQTPPCTSGEVEWAYGFGGTQADSANDLITDAAGNVYVVGDFQTTVSFGGGAVTSAGLTDAFLAKYDPDGAYVMARRFGDAQAQVALGVGLDAQGDIYLAGNFQSTIDFGGAAFSLVSAGADDVFVAKLDPTGAPLWAKRYGDGAEQAIHTRGLAVDAAGDAVLTGSYQGMIDFGGGALVVAPADNVFLAKLSPQGNQLWAHGFGDATSQSPSAIALGPGGRVAITGSFQGSINFGGATLMSHGADDVFVAVFDALGGHVWSQGYGDVANQEGLAIAFDALGDVYVAGAFQGSLDLGGGPLVAVGPSSNIFLAQFDPNGVHLHSARYGDGTAPGQNARSVTVDAGGNVVLVGDFGGSLDFGSGALVSAGGSDLFAAKLGPAWNVIFAERWGDAAPQTAGAVTTDAAGNVVLGGAFFGTIAFTANPLVSAGVTDAFIAKLAP